MDGGFNVRLLICVSGFNVRLCPCILSPSHPFRPNASGREGETAGGVFVRPGAPASRGCRPEGSVPTSVRGLSKELPPHQGQGQGHPLWEDWR